MDHAIRIRIKVSNIQKISINEIKLRFSWWFSKSQYLTNNPVFAEKMHLENKALSEVKTFWFFFLRMVF